jgi:hypothetical protein
MLTCPRLTLAVVALWVIWHLSGARAEDSEGQWQEKTEVVWDASTQQLVRRSFRVWDPHPELGLEFHWAPETDGGKQTGPIEGKGTLIWYRRGAALHDYASRYSTYTGNLKNGRPDGSGKLTTHAGLIYEGAWEDGRMEGEGAIEYETGLRYRGRFHAGEPDGSGTYVAANGQLMEVADISSATHLASFGLSPLGERPMPVPPASMQIAQNADLITMNLYVDRAMNNQFKNADPEFDSYVYGQAKAGDTVEIRLDAPEIMARWQGDGVITANSNDLFLLDPHQFAPVFLVVDVINDSDHAAQVTGGYVDVAHSSTAWEPYLEITGIWYLADEKVFDPTFVFANEGWGPAQNAKVTYSFGKTLGGQTFAIDVGTFDQSKEVSTLPGFKASGTDVARLEEARYPCPSFEMVPSCLINLKRSGLFGALADHVYNKDRHVYVQVTGAIDYDWTDAQGNTQHRRSPISVELPVLAFVVGPMAEYGPPEAVNRKFPAIKLGLDGENYRIPLRYRERLGAQQNKRFALTIDADKSSHHVFRIVLQLADGRTVATPPVDLLMFKPRAAELY